ARNIGMVWIKQDPEGCAEWLHTIPASVQSDVLRSFLNRTLRDSLDVDQKSIAVKLLSEFPIDPQSPGLFAAAAGVVADQSGRSAAMQWLESAPEQIRNEELSRFWSAQLTNGNRETIEDYLKADTFLPSRETPA